MPRLDRRAAHDESVRDVVDDDGVIGNGLRRHRAAGRRAAQATTAAGAYPDVSGLQPFAAETNYMSRAGYLKWTAFKDQQVWLSTVEAQRIVAGQEAR